jgi:hypothetical protein
MVMVYVRVVHLLLAELTVYRRHATVTIFKSG